MARRTEDDVFKLKPKNPQTRAEITDSTVRVILKEEADERTSLTRKLRAARLAREAEAPEPVPAKTPRRTTRKPRTRTA
jgi:hypothetical protein